MSTHSPDLAPKDTPLRVLVVADDPLVRVGLRQLVSEAGGFEQTDSNANPEAVAHALAATHPDVLLWVFSAVAPSPDALPDVPTVAILPDEAALPVAYAAGALGFLPRSADADAMASALRAVWQGLVVLDPAYTDAALRLINTPIEPDDLTLREHEVLRLLAEGLPNKQIADRLNISEHTVKFHVSSILSKLGASSRTEAVMQAVRRGWLAV